MGSSFFVEFPTYGLLSFLGGWPWFGGFEGTPKENHFFFFFFFFLGEVCIPVEPAKPVGGSFKNIEYINYSSLSLSFLDSFSPSFFLSSFLSFLSFLPPFFPSFYLSFLSFVCLSIYLSLPIYT